MTAKKATTAKVVVRAPFKVSHAGVGYWPGDTAEVPPTVAAEWVKVGYADPVDQADGQADADQADTGPKRSRRN